MDFFSVLLVLFISVIVFYYFSTTSRLPGPLSYPFIGNSILVKKLCKKYGGLHLALEELCKQYKTNILCVTLGRDYTIVVQSEKILNQVLSSNEFQARPDNFFVRLRSMGNLRGITMTDGKLWVEQRAFAVKQLHELGLGKRRTDEMIQDQLQDLMMTLEKWEISSVSLRKRFSKCVLNVLWEIITGETFKHNEQTLNDLISFMEERAKAFDMSGGLLAQFPFIRYVFPEYSGFKLIKTLNNKFKNMIMSVINEHKKTYSKYLTRDYIDAFLHEMNKSNGPGSTFTEDQLIMVCLDFFIAGAQTTSSTLDFLFCLMILKPDIQEKVQKELDEILKPGQLPSYEDRHKCPYVNAVILESQRLNPVAPLIGPRRVTSDTTLDGYLIPKGATVFLNIHQYCHDPKIWQNPEVMKPERFLDKKGELMSDHRLFTFGKGKRRCPGEALAKNFLFVFFAGLIHNYKLVQGKENPPSLKVVPGITLSPAEYSIKMIKRFS